MAVDERRRHALHTAAQRQLGDEEADTLMELLPPVGWADVATKQDIAAIEQDIVASENRLYAMMHADFRQQTLHLMTILVPSLLGTIVAAFTAARLG
jgi:hypothetical protein